MADSPPPILSPPSSQEARYKELSERFKKVYGRSPDFFVRAPGRVNLIGEHIDYCGYAVLPMAIEQDIVIAASANNEQQLKLTNTNDKFQSYSCAAATVDIDSSAPKWFHYFLCGYKGIVEHFDLSQSVGIDALVDGTIPASAGLSSSSALVCAAALVTMKANNKSCSKVEVAEISQRCERFVGTEGGGMDQAISMLAEEGSAKLIEFNPLKTTEILLPPGANFVISNCCQDMNKAATAHFNTRVTECRLATQVLAKSKGLQWRLLRRLCDLQTTLGVTQEDMTQLVEATLHKEPYSKSEICGLLGVTADELAETSLNAKTLHVDSFKLYDRALHVYSEAARVLTFRKVCGAGTDRARALEELGLLMDASHSSCQQLYECSCEDLDQLTQLAKSAGALGSRLTGAGWGGCAVSLVTSDKIDAFQKQLTEEFYQKTDARKSRLKESLFATKPGRGACYYLS